MEDAQARSIVACAANRMAGQRLHDRRIETERKSGRAQIGHAGDPDRDGGRHAERQRERRRLIGRADMDDGPGPGACHHPNPAAQTAGDHRIALRVRCRFDQRRDQTLSSQGGSRDRLEGQVEKPDLARDAGAGEQVETNQAVLRIVGRVAEARRRGRPQDAAGGSQQARIVRNEHRGERQRLRAGHRDADGQREADAFGQIIGKRPGILCIGRARADLKGDLVGRLAGGRSRQLPGRVRGEQKQGHDTDDDDGASRAAPCHLMRHARASRSDLRQS